MADFGFFGIKIISEVKQSTAKRHYY